MADHIQVILTRTKCKDEMDSEDGSYRGVHGRDLFGKDYVKRALDNVSNKEYIGDLAGKYPLSGFEDQEKLKTYLNGYRAALFWICSFFDIIQYFDDKIYPKFKKSEEGDK